MVTVIVEEPAPVIEVGLKLAEAPAGKPLTLGATLRLKPSRAEVETV